MAMSDELGSSVVQISSQAVTGTLQLISEILRMIHAQREHSFRMNEMKLRSGIDISTIKPGEVSLKSLLKNARENGQALSKTENAICDKDAAFVAKKAKEYGIPIAITKTGTSNYIHCRSNDVDILKHVMTDLMHNKFQNKENVGNFKVESWEIPYITAELNKHNINATFGRAKINNENVCFCLYDKAYEKAVLIARAEFINKYRDVKNDFMFDRDEEGFFTVKDIKTGIETRFDDQYISCRDFARKMRDTFHYDENKANIAAARFGEEMFKGEEKKNYFSNPQNSTRSIIYNITFDSDDIYAKQYVCMRVVPKNDSLQRIAFVAPDGRFAALDPNMNRETMVEELKNHLETDDAKEIDSLISKAEKAMLYYAKREDPARYSSEYKFGQSDFKLDNTDVLKREADGHTFTRSVPIDQLNIKINRDGKENFNVRFSALHLEKNEKDEISTFADNDELTFSFNDKKQAVHELQQKMVDMGVPETVASRAAHDVFIKAESQEIEQPIYITDVSVEETEYYKDNLNVEAEVYTHGKSIKVDVTNENKAREQIKEAFGVTESDKPVIKIDDKKIYNQIDDKTTQNQHYTLTHTYGYPLENVRELDRGESWYLIRQNVLAGNESISLPEEFKPNNFKPDTIRCLSHNFDKLMRDTMKADGKSVIPHATDIIEMDVPSIGGR